MKITYLANVRFPSERAHATQIAHMCQAFAGNGIEVNLVVNNSVVATPEEIDKELGFHVDFKISRIKSLALRHSYKISFFLSELSFAFNFHSKHKREHYDYIYSRSEWVLWFLNFVYPPERLVWESHEAKLTFPAKRLFKKGIKTVVISEGIYNEYLEFGLQKKQILVAHDGIDESFFGELESKENVRKRLGISGGKRIVMYIGGFDKWKGVETFFEGAGNSPELAFYAIGGRAEQVDLYKKKYPHVNFLGPKPYSELRYNQQAADILVIPNSGVEELSSKYTSPLKLFAHMASGVPMLVSDLESMKNVLNVNEVTFFKPDNSASLNESLKIICLNYGEKLSSAKILIEKSKKYTWNNRAKKVIEFITNY